MKFPKFIFLAVLTFSISSCEVNVYLDDPELSGNTAADFLEQFLIEKNSTKAYAYFHEEFKKMLPKEDLEKMIEVTKGAPKIKLVEAISYVTSSEVKGNIAVYLIATRADDVEAFLAVYTNGGSIDGYKIIGLKTLGEITDSKSLPGERYKDRDSIIERRI